MSRLLDELMEDITNYGLLMAEMGRLERTLQLIPNNKLIYEERNSKDLEAACLCERIEKKIEELIS